jgi:hypothetical protein
MIGCPYCGTMNRRGSRYCGNCGERLDTVPSTRCPSCNAPNLSGNERCAFCGAPLEVPDEAPEAGISAGLIASASTEEAEEAEPESLTAEELPSWLYDLPTEPRHEVVPATASPAVPEQEGPEPNRYLQDIGGVFPKTDGWLSPSLRRHLSASSNQAQTPEDT